MTFNPMFDPARIRKRPGMYVGDITDGSGLHNMIFGILDLVLNWRRGVRSIPVSVRLDKDGVCTILGDPQPELLSIARVPDVPAILVVFNTLHGTGTLKTGYYDDDWRSADPFCVNALSDWLDFRMTLGAKDYAMVFVKGEISLPLQVISDARMEGVHSPKTEISFRPCPDIFADCDFDAQTIIAGMRERARRPSTASLIFIDARGDEVRRQDI